MTSDRVDVLVVGASAAGLTAALSAADSGRRVLVAEASPLLGGTGSVGGGAVWLPAGSETPRGAIGEELDEAYAYLANVGGHDGVDLESLRDLVATSVPTARLLLRHGVELRIVPRTPDLHFPRVAGSAAGGRQYEVVSTAADLPVDLGAAVRRSPYYPVGQSRAESLDRGGVGYRHAELRRQVRDGTHRSEPRLGYGAGLVAALLGAGVRTGRVEFATSTRVERLLTRGDAVHGAVLRTPDAASRDMFADAVIVAAGARSPRDLRDLPPGTLPTEPVSVAGDGVELAASVGARVVEAGSPMLVLGFPLHGDGFSVWPLHESLGLPHGIVVDRTGRRFGDESYYGSLVPGALAIDAAGARPHYPAFAIVDADYIARYGFGPFENPGPVYDDAGETVVAVGDDIPELARALGIEERGLAATIEDFNARVASGRPDPFGRGQRPFTARAWGDGKEGAPSNLGTVTRSPFVGVRLTAVTTGVYSSGLVTDSSGRVLRDGDAIEGLRAAGNVVAMREFDAYIVGYSMFRSLVMGYAAGRLD